MVYPSLGSESLCDSSDLLCFAPQRVDASKISATSGACTALKESCTPFSVVGEVANSWLYAKVSQAADAVSSASARPFGAPVHLPHASTVVAVRIRDFREAPGVQRIRCRAHDDIEDAAEVPQGDGISQDRCPHIASVLAVSGISARNRWKVSTHSRAGGQTGNEVTG